MKTINNYIREALIKKDTKLFNTSLSVIDKINEVIPIEENEKEYDAVKSWILKYNIKNIKLIMSNSAFSELCPDCEDDFQYIKEFDYVDVDDTVAAIVEDYIFKKTPKLKYIYKTWRDEGWQIFNDELNHVLIYKMSFGEYIFIVSNEDKLIRN